MHYSVLLDESIALLNIKPDGIYIDGTFGRGGHSQKILEQLGNDGHLIAFDKDPEAVDFARKHFVDPRFSIIHDSFANLEQHLDQLQLSSVDGVLLDLGVSSPQLDDARRGFSFRFDAELDMRMNNSSGVTAREWLAIATEEELSEVFWNYGEERFSRRIAKAIVAKREQAPITTTTELVKLVEAQIPFKERGKSQAARIFQAIRIKINNELSDIEKTLDKAPYLLNKNGRMVVISFHSLEDRLVKLRFNELAKGNELPKWAMVKESPAEFNVVAKKIKAGFQELDENNRSRSAVLRCLERGLIKK